jgi:hypothetical protein
VVGGLLALAHVHLEVTNMQLAPALTVELLRTSGGATGELWEALAFQNGTVSGVVEIQ